MRLLPKSESHQNRAIDHVRVGSATALYDALFLGSEALEPRQGRKVMVVITDGGDTMSKVNLPRKQCAPLGLHEAILCQHLSLCLFRLSAGRDTGGEHALIQLSASTGRKIFLRVVAGATR